MKQNRKAKIHYFSILEWISIFLVLTLLSVLPAMLYGGNIRELLFNDYTWWYLLYWVVVTSCVCTVSAYQKYKTFSYPLTQLSMAAKAVAAGDFSVYIKSKHRFDKKDYLDTMFDDFNQMVKELGSIETLKNDFISHVSHEIKTPLAIIGNYTTLLKSNQLSESERKLYLDAMSDATTRLSTLVSNILRLNKLENQQLPMTNESFDLCRQLSDCILSFESLLDEKKIDCQVELEDQAMIVAHEELLALVWNNLLSNAIKFTSENKTILIKQTSLSDAILVEVTDTGCGMSEETRNHIFDKFYQGESSHFTQGNGLGLAIVNRVLDKMSASISVTSQPNKGTTFLVRFDVN